MTEREREESSARKDSAVAAREKIREAEVGLSVALQNVRAIVGDGHDATQSVHEALRASQVAGAKLDILIRRIP